MRFRASPHIELKRLGELAPDQAEAFRELERDADFYGLFVPRPPLATTVKSVTRQTAELFLALTEPSRLDTALLRDESVIDLVLDGILEIERGDGFVAGADALPLVGNVDQSIADSISRDALLHAQDLETSEIEALASALYHYNRIPLSPFWRARFPNAAAVLAHLGANLDREWKASEFGKTWLSWSRRTSIKRDAAGVTFKLYVSPRPEHIRDAFAVLARVLSASPAFAFKIGNSAAGLLRPDKLVAYFMTREELFEAAGELRRELAGCDAQGVPFTAPFDEDGLLSWGIDPPESERALRWLGRNSWRSWLTQRLAAAIAVAKSACRADAVEPWRFAIERARRHGVEIETWTPLDALWSTT